MTKHNILSHFIKMGRSGSDDAFANASFDYRKTNAGNGKGKMKFYGIAQDSDTSLVEQTNPHTKSSASTLL
jgi:hypothetical protein